MGTSIHSRLQAQDAQIADLDKLVKCKALTAAESYADAPLSLRLRSCETGLDLLGSDLEVACEETDALVGELTRQTEALAVKILHLERSLVGDNASGANGSDSLARPEAASRLPTEACEPQHGSEEMSYGGWESVTRRRCRCQRTTLSWRG